MSYIIQRCARRCRVAGHTVFVTIIVDGIARALHFHRCIDFGDAEGTRLGRHRVVRVGSSKRRHGDRVVTCSLTRHAAQAVHRSHTARRHTRRSGRQFRIGAGIIVIRFRLVVSLEGDGLRRDAEGARLGRHRVVRVGNSGCRHGDRVVTHILTRHAAQAVHRSHTARRHTRRSGRQFRIGAGIIVIRFRLVVSLEGDGLRRDFEVARLVGHGIVALNRITARSDGVVTHIFARCTAYRVGNQALRLTVHHSCDRSCKRGRICVTIHLCLIISFHRH